MNFDRVRNRQEARVQAALMAAIDARPGILDDETDLHDAYALALNKLPARYAHEMTIVLRKSTTKEEIEAAVAEAIETVRKNPSSSKAPSTAA